VIKMS